MSRFVAYHISTATRGTIFEKNIGKAAPNLKDIRIALGWRQHPLGNGNKPVFVSEHVQNLYNGIQRLFHKLPVHNVAEIRRCWHQGSLLKDDIEDLVLLHGHTIWGAPILQRDITNNPNSPLLEARPDSAYATDLFFGKESHRDYIKLQLEHLAYATAIRYYHNQRLHERLRTDREKAKNSLPHARDGAENRLSLIVKLKMPMNTGLTRKRRIDEEQSAALPYRNQHPSPFARNSGISEALKTPKRNITAHRELRSSTSNSNFQSYRSPASNGQGQSRCGLGSSSSLSSPPSDNLPEDGDCFPSPRLAQLEPIAHNPPQDPPQPSSPAPRDRDQNADTQDSFIHGQDDGAAGRNEVEASTSDNITEDKFVDPWERCTLRDALVSELWHLDLIDEECSEQISTEKRWERSEMINGLLIKLWDAKRASSMAKMGDEAFQVSDKALKSWVQWREAAQKIGSRIGMHPSEDISRPAKTYREWVGKLGGLPEYVKLDKELSRHREQILELGLEPDGIAKRLPGALHIATEHPGEEEFFSDVTGEYNRRLFSWKLDLL